MKKSHFIAIFAGFLALVLLGVAGFLFFGEKKFPLDSDNFGSTSQVTITGEEYEDLIKNQKSFLIFVDQSGCITAEGLKKLVNTTSESKNLRFYRIMYADMRNTSLFGSVKYYPSVALVNKGKVVSWLRADADEDINRYKDQKSFDDWLNQHIEWN